LYIFPIIKNNNLIQNCGDNYNHFEFIVPNKPDTPTPPSSKHSENNSINILFIIIPIVIVLILIVIVLIIFFIKRKYKVNNKNIEEDVLREKLIDIEN